MFDKIRQLLTPPVFKDDDDKTYTAGLLNIILLSILFGSLLYGLAAPLVATVVLLRLAYVGSFVLVVVGLLVLTRRGYVRFVSVATVVSVWALLTLASVTSGGVRAPAFSGYIIVIISAGLLLGWRAALGSALACTLMGALMVYAGAQGALPLPRLEHDDVSLWLSQAIYFLVAAVLITLALRRVTDALQRAHGEIAERTQIEDALRASEERFRRLSEAAFEGIMIHDRGIILDANQAFADLFHHPHPDDLIGKNGLEELPLTPESQQRIQANMRSGSTLAFEIAVVRQDGSIVHAETQGRTMLYQGREVRVVAMRDITARKRAEEALQRYAARMEILHEIDQAILAAQSIEAVVQAALSRIHLLTPNRRAGVILFNTETDEALAVAAITNGQMGDVGTRFPLSEFEIADALRQGRVHVRNDLSNVTTLSPVEQRMLAKGVRAYLDAPLTFQGELIGALGVEATAPGAFHEDVVELVCEVADQLAIAIQNARLLKQTQHYTEELEQRVAERTRELAEANERLTELDRLKSKFVSDVSHELRTPITNLKLYLELLARGQAEKRESYLAILKRQADRLAQLVEDILSLSRLELGRDRVAFAPVDVNALVAEIVAVHQPRAGAAGLALRFEPGANLPAVWGEVNQLAQVVTNLVANALNYTRAGHVQVSTFQSEQGVCLCVEDTGIGIDPIDLPYLFDRFYRSKRSVEMNIPGTGLGLSIVKEIVGLHGGRIEVESEVGKGTTFRLWLPRGG